MSIEPSQVWPADVLVVRTKGWAAWFIRLGAALRDRPNLGNHIAVMHHYTDGIPWGIEGRPGGVDWVDLRPYLRSKYLQINVTQPKSAEQRTAVCETMEVMLGKPYDWEAIAADAFESLGIRKLFTEDWEHSGVPGHVVCSSLADYAYEAAQLASPNGDKTRRTTPGDWSKFIMEEGWK